MKILFLNPPFGAERPEGLDPPLGIMFLGAVLKEKGHETRLVDHAWVEAGDWSVWDKALDDGPEAVLVNTQIRFERDAAEAMRRLRAKRPDLPAAAFGPQASTEAPRLLGELGFDVCVIGEPDDVIPAWLAEGAFRPGPGNASRPGLAGAAHPVPEPAPRVDMERLPEPDYDLVDYRRYIDRTLNAVFLASRGLNHIDAFYQPTLIHALNPTRRVSVDKALAGLQYLRSRFDGRFLLLFHDEAFTEDRNWVMELCRALPDLKLGLPFWCFTRPDLLDEELTRVMVRAGFAGVSLGLESASDRVLETLGRGLTRDQILSGFRAARKAGLLITGSVMIGTPGETEADLAATVDMIARHRPDVLTVTLTTPLPGTGLHGRFADRLLIEDPEDFNYYDHRPGRTPLRLDDLTGGQLEAALARLRSNWKRGLWRTGVSLARTALRNPPFRRACLGPILRVARRKIWKEA
ncbi:MAG: radical SAM protein [Thermodesulfobacteriota bacterium]